MPATITLRGTSGVRPSSTMAKYSWITAIASSSCRLYSWMRLACTSNIDAGSSVTPASAFTTAASRRLLARLTAAKSSRNAGSSAQASSSLEEQLEDPPDLVIAVCGDAARSRPTLPGTTHFVRWPFEDPAAARGSDDEILAVFRAVRDAIRGRIETWVEEGFAPLKVAG